MKVIKTIRIRKENIGDIRKLECVENVVEKDEYLVKWKSGKWQRFGETAINNLYKNPGKEAGSTWEDE
jgi:hypothetical protein